MRERSSRGCCRPPGSARRSLDLRRFGVGARGALGTGLADGAGVATRAAMSLRRGSCGALVRGAGVGSTCGSGSTSASASGSGSIGTGRTTLGGVGRVTIGAALTIGAGGSGSVSTFSSASGSPVRLRRFFFLRSTRPPAPASAGAASVGAAGNAATGLRPSASSMPWICSTWKSSSTDAGPLICEKPRSFSFLARSGPDRPYSLARS